MHFDVFVQVSFLCETLVATLLAAFVRLFGGVNTQMVEEVVPFSKIF